MKDKAIVYVIQEIPGTREGRPKINIMGAQKYGDIKVLLKEDSQIIFSPGPVIFSLRQKLKNRRLFITDRRSRRLFTNGTLQGPIPIKINSIRYYWCCMFCEVIRYNKWSKYNLLKWDRTPSDEKLKLPVLFSL